MSSKLFGGSRAKHEHLLRSGGLPAEIKDVRDDVEAAFSALETRGGLIYTDEFTNPPAADNDYFKTSFATVASEVVLEAADLTASSIATGPRNVVITRTDDAGAYTTDDIIIEGTAYGVKRTLTFTPADTDAAGGDVIEANEAEGLDTITKVTIPAQTLTSGAFTIGFGPKLGLRGAVKARAGLTAALREVAVGAVVTTGTFSGRLYTPASAPDAARDYAVTYEVNPAG